MPKITHISFGQGNSFRQPSDPELVDSPTLLKLKAIGIGESLDICFRFEQEQSRWITSQTIKDRKRRNKAKKQRRARTGRRR